jgi:hypothetical protein
MKRSRLVLILGAVALVAATAALVVGQAGAASSPHRGAWKAACTKLLSDPTAREAMLELRQEHVAEMQAWRDTYGSDPTTPQARRALADLRQEHWADMRALMEEFGIKVPARMRGGMMGGAFGGGMMDGSGTGMMGDGSGGMMGGDGGGMMGGSSF